LRISANPLLLFIKTSHNIRMKTAMELALARIELMKDISPDSVHWEMFKNDCMEKEKEQIQKAFSDGQETYSDSLTPIELPSDEDIDKQAFQVPYDGTDTFYDKSFINGAKWMKEQILNQNK